MQQPLFGKDKSELAGHGAAMSPSGSHMLFVLTANLHCMLFGYNSAGKRVDLISKGYLKDQACALREPPYSMFLSDNKKFIILMLYDNCIKVVPILKNSASRIQLANAFDVRVLHAEINSIQPI